MSAWQLNPLLIADVAYQALRRYWGINIGDWDARRIDETGDRGPWEDQPWLAREAAALPGQTFERERPDGTKTLYRRTADGWRTEPDDLTDPHRGTLHQNAANWRGTANRWRRRLTLAKAEGDEQAAAQAQDEVDTAERIADVKERYPHVKVLPDATWTFDPATGTLDDGGVLEHSPISPDGYRETAESLRAHSEIVELADPLTAARMRVQADDYDRKADDREADEALAAAADDFEKAASGDTFGVARAALMTKPDGDAYLTCTSCDGRGCAVCRGWGWTTHPDACGLPATGHPCTSCVGKVGCAQPTPEPPPRSAPTAPQPTRTTPPTSSSSGASMSGSIGDAAAGIRGSNDTAGEANGILAAAIAKVEEARGQLQAAVAGSPQADSGDVMGLYGAAIGAIEDAQKAVLAAVSAAESVAARL